MHVGPIVYRPVTAVRPVTKVGPASVGSVIVEALSGRSTDDKRDRSHGRRRRRDTQDAGVASSSRGPADALTLALAVLSLDHGFWQASGVAPPNDERAPGRSEAAAATS